MEKSISAFLEWRLLIGFWLLKIKAQSKKIRNDWTEIASVVQSCLNQVWVSLLQPRCCWITRAYNAGECCFFTQTIRQTSIILLGWSHNYIVVLHCMKHKVILKLTIAQVVGVVVVLTPILLSPDCVSANGWTILTRFIAITISCLKESTPALEFPVISVISVPVNFFKCLSIEFATCLNV